MDRFDGRMLDLSTLDALEARLIAAGDVAGYPFTDQCGATKRATDFFMAVQHGAITSLSGDDLLALRGQYRTELIADGVPEAEAARIALAYHILLAKELGYFSQAV